MAAARIITNDQVEKKIRDTGLRPSSARIRVLRYLEENRDHPTVDTIYKSLLPELPGLSRSSVYNSLASLEKMKLVRPLTINGDELRYDAAVVDHGHFYCERCGMIFDFNYSLPGISESLPGFHACRSDYLVWGVCAECELSAEDIG